MTNGPKIDSLGELFPPDETSLSLIERAKGDDDEAWRRIVRIYGPLVYSWVRKAGLQPSDASDVVQDVFAAVSRSLGRFRKESTDHSFRGWLWTTSRNKIHDFWRKFPDDARGEGGTTANLRLQDLPEPELSSEIDDDRAENRALRLRAMRECQGLFEGRVWDSFWQVVVDGRPPADVARELGVSVWAVYKAKSRVIERLRRELDGLLVLEAG